MTTVPNKGSAGLFWDLTVDKAVVSAPPTASVVRTLYPFNGAEPESPLSYEKLVADPPVCRWQSADRTDGVGWVDSGTSGSDLVYVDAPLYQVDHMTMPKIAGNYLSTPDSAALDMVGSTIEIVARLSCEWFSDDAQTIIAKRDGVDNSYELWIEGGVNAGQLNFVSSQAATFANTRCLHVVPFVNGETGWIKVTWDGALIKYYVAADEPTEPTVWRQIGKAGGGTQQALATAIVATTSDVYIGAVPVVGVNSYMEGRFYYLAMRSSIGGGDILVVDIPTDTTGMTVDVTTTFVATSGQTITLAVSGTPPATCRVERTAVTIPHPWYEIDFPTALSYNSAVDKVFMAYVTVDITTHTGSDSRLPVISCIGIDPSDTSPWPAGGGWAIYYQGADEKIGAAINMAGGLIKGGMDTTSWTPAGVAAETVTYFIFLDRSYSSGYVAAWLGAYGDASGDLGGDPPIGPYLIGPEQEYKIRIMEWNGTVGGVGLDIVDAGVTSLLHSKPKEIRSFVAADWVADRTRYGRAILGLTPLWTLGDTAVSTGIGTPTFCGQAVSTGDVLIAGAGTDVVEGSVVWSVNPLGAQVPVWANFEITDLWSKTGEDYTIPDTDHVFFWIVFSTDVTNGSVFPLLEITGWNTNTYIYVDFEPVTPYVYAYIGSDNAEYNDITVFGGWTLPATDVGDPIMIAIWARRDSPSDRALVWVEGMPAALPFDGVGTFNLDTFTIDGTAGAYVRVGGYEGFQPGVYFYAAGFDHGPDLVEPTPASLAALKADVLAGTYSTL